MKMSKQKVNSFLFRGQITALYVVAHAKWQRSRGRGPSVSFLGEKNTRKALQKAIEALKTYEAMAGYHVGYAARNMVFIADLIGEAVTTDFNGIEIKVLPGDNAEAIVEFFKAQSKRRYEEWLASPAGKRYLREQEAERQKQERIGKYCLGYLRVGLDFSNLNAVIAWFEAYQEPSDHVGVDVPYETIIKTFRENGFEPDVNCKDNFDGEDKENFARWIIGQGLSCLASEAHAIHSIIDRFAKEWREKFGEKEYSIFLAKKATV